VNSPANRPRRRTPQAAQPRASRWVFSVASVVVLALALAACSSGSAAPSSASPVTPASPITSAAPSATTPAGTPSAPASAPAPSGSPTAGNGGDTLQLAAQGIKFSTDQLQAPAGKAFSISFENNDSGIAHNVEILDANNTSVFKGAIFPGVATQNYQVSALKAGTYSFICDVHPNIMTGTLTVE